MLVEAAWAAARVPELGLGQPRPSWALLASSDLSRFLWSPDRAAAGEATLAELRTWDVTRRREGRAFERVPNAMKSISAAERF
jgi:hypothetical protein